MNSSTPVPVGAPAYHLPALKEQLVLITHYSRIEPAESLKALEKYVAAFKRVASPHSLMFAKILEDAIARLTPIQNSRKAELAATALWAGEIALGML